MGKYYCDYCHSYLTHDSLSVRKNHIHGKQHVKFYNEYYQNIIQQYPALAEAVLSDSETNYLEGIYGGIPGENVSLNADFASGRTPSFKLKVPQASAKYPNPPPNAVYVSQAKLLTVSGGMRKYASNSGNGADSRHSFNGYRSTGRTSHRNTNRAPYQKPNASNSNAQGSKMASFAYNKGSANAKGHNGRQPGFAPQRESSPFGGPQQNSQHNQGYRQGYTPEYNQGYRQSYGQGHGQAYHQGYNATMGQRKEHAYTPGYKNKQGNPRTSSPGANGNPADTGSRHPYNSGYGRRYNSGYNGSYRY